jgi:hypothetical protein
LYEKIFRFDKCTSEWSAGSESIELLTKKILIRKEFGRERKNQRRSLSDVRSAARSSFEMLRSNREPLSSTLVVMENTERLVNYHNDGKNGNNSEVLENESKTIK